MAAAATPPRPDGPTQAELPLGPITPRAGGGPPPPDRLAQAELAALFPVPDRFGAGIEDTLATLAAGAPTAPRGFALDAECQIFPGWWTDGVDELHGASVPEEAVEAWRQALRDGTADADAHEWRLSDRGLDRPALRRQIEMIATTLESMAVAVRWSPSRMSFGFTYATDGMRPADGRVCLDQRTSDIPVVHADPERDNPLLTADEVRALAAALVLGVGPYHAEATERMLFVSRNWAEMPTEVMEKAGVWGREIIDRCYRVGADSSRIVIVATHPARPTAGPVECVYDGDDEPRAIHAALDHVTAAASEMAAMERGATAQPDPYAPLSEEELAATAGIVERLGEIGAEAAAHARKHRPRSAGMGM